MNILFAGSGFKHAASVLLDKIKKINTELDESNHLNLIFQDHQKPLEAQLENISVLIPTMEKIDEKIIKNGKQLRLIQQFGVGLEGVDIAAANKYDVPVANAPGTNGITVAETAIFLMLALCKNLNLILQVIFDFIPVVDQAR